MAYDESLADRIRQLFTNSEYTDEKKMFGGLAFMLNGHMCCGVIKDKLMARVGLDQYESSLQKSHTHKMDFTGKPLKGFIYIDPEGVESEKELEVWVNICKDFVFSLPPK